MCRYRAARCAVADDIEVLTVHSGCAYSVGCCQVSTLGSVRLAIQGAVSNAFKTPEARPPSPALWCFRWPDRPSRAGDQALRKPAAGAASPAA